LWVSIPASTPPPLRRCGLAKSVSGTQRMHLRAAGAHAPIRRPSPRTPKTSPAGSHCESHPEPQQAARGGASPVTPASAPPGATGQPHYRRCSRCVGPSPWLLGPGVGAPGPPSAECGWCRRRDWDACRLRVSAPTRVALARRRHLPVGRLEPRWGVTGSVASVPLCDRGFVVPLSAGAPGAGSSGPERSLERDPPEGAVVRAQQSEAAGMERSEWLAQKAASERADNVRQRRTQPPWHAPRAHSVSERGRL